MNFRRKVALALADILFLFLSLVLALGLRLDFDLGSMERFLSLEALLLYVGVAMWGVVSFSLFGLYDKVWRYAGVYELLGLFYACLLTFVPWEIFVLWGAGIIYPRTAAVIAGLLGLAACGGLRFLLRIQSTRRVLTRAGKRKALVVGANDGGEAIVRELAREDSGLVCVGLVDPDPQKKGLRIHGAPVLGDLSEIPALSAKYGVQALILAGVKPALVREVVRLTSAQPELQLRIMPNLSEVMEGQVQVNRLREVQIEDLLERDPVVSDMQAVRGYLEGETVLVTGAGGSIGSEICRQVLKYGAKRVILLGRGENSIYEIGMELRNQPVVQFISNVGNKERMEVLFQRYHPQVVFHAAAHKHVPLMELNPSEAVTNNVFGTKLLIELAQKYGVRKLITISTDKAVNPTSVMGASKRLAELILASRKIPGFAAVRFGNVLGSRGSVIPTFKRQIAQGGPVTVTDPQMTRYFMTIPEAVSLVLQAGSLAQGGEIYVLDMGHPVKIIDLARNLIRLSGYEPDVDIPIKIVGLRPGEKLYEELTNTGEETEPTTIPKITRVTTEPPPANWSADKLEELRKVSFASDDAQTVEILKSLVLQTPSSEPPSTP